MFTISDVYRYDLPEGSIFILEYPSSHKPNFGNPDFLVNSTKYLADDEYRAHDYESNRIEKPHRNLPVLGDRVRAYVAEPPHTALADHWQRRLGTKPLRYGELGEPVPHVCLFPVQDLPPELHAVDPDMHYYVYSKNFIAEVDCPQPIVFNELKCPSVLKVCRSSGGHGTWMIHKEEDYDYWINEIRSTMPHAEMVLTEMVTDIKHHMCCHLYLSRGGHVKWLAVTEKILVDDVIWIGAVMQMSHQDKWKRLLRGATEPVSEALHERDFFGLYGIDVLVDAAGRQFVVDINPRILGSTPLVFTSLSLQRAGRGLDVGIFLTDVVVKSTSHEALVTRAEAVEDGELIVYSIVDKGDSEYQCQIGVFGATIAKCQAIADAFC